MTCRPPRRRPGVLTSVLAPVVAGLLTLTSCGALPTDDKVRPGEALNQNPVVQPVQVAPDGPQSGATQEQIVQGFLRAMSDTRDDYAVARQFLAEDASGGWHPDEVGAVVYQDDEQSGVNVLRLRSDSTDADVLQVSVTSEGVIDTDGIYQADSPGSRRNVLFTVSKVSGEWRISQLPDRFGRWVSRGDFGNAYAQVNIYYAAAKGHNVLVADPRWVPQGSGMITAVARLQVQPPPEYLRGAVRTGMPEGTQLAVDSVSVDERTATVRLEGQRPSFPSPDQRALMHAQLAYALRQRRLLAVDNIEVRWGNTSVDNGSGDIYTPLAPSSPYLLLRNDRGIGAVRQEGTALVQFDLPVNIPESQRGRVSPPVLPSLGEEWEQVSASEDIRLMAAVRRGGKELGTWSNGSPGPVHKTAGSTTTPSFDEFPGVPGFWFAAGDAKSSGIWWISTERQDKPARPVHIQTPWLGRQQIRALRVSADNTRMAVLLHDPAKGGYTVSLIAILRDIVTGKPVATTAPRAIGMPLTSAEDIAWSDESTIVVLGEEVVGSPMRALLINPAGEPDRLAPLPDAQLVTTASGSGAPTIYLTDKYGACYLSVGGGWSAIAQNAELISPGE